MLHIVSHVCEATAGSRFKQQQQQMGQWSAKRECDEQVCNGGDTDNGPAASAHKCSWECDCRTKKKRKTTKFKITEQQQGKINNASKQRKKNN